MATAKQPTNNSNEPKITQPANQTTETMSWKSTNQPTNQPTNNIQLINIINH